jgi:hypothetical protein
MPRVTSTATRTGAPVAGSLTRKMFRSNALAPVARGSYIL